MYDYPIFVQREADHVWSSCPDIPEAHSAGGTVEELMENAVGGMRLALTIYVDRNRTIPRASAPVEGQCVVCLPVQTVAKIELWNAMRHQGVRVADLARRLGLLLTAANRLVDFEWNSRIEQVEVALATLGRRLRVEAVPVRDEAGGQER